MFVGDPTYASFNTSYPRDNAIIIWNVTTRLRAEEASSSNSSKITYSGTTMTLITAGSGGVSATNKAASQLNTEGKVYYWIAIG